MSPRRGPRVFRFKERGEVSFYSKCIYPADRAQYQVIFQCFHANLLFFFLGAELLLGSNASRLNEHFHYLFCFQSVLEVLLAAVPAYQFDHNVK